MRAAALALVLIVGAAVVLWFGNTLNSWVLGGLIGGLAALLLSIPISVALFSYLSRRHDERLKAEAEEASLAYAYDYPEMPVEIGRYETDVYLLPDGETWSDQQETDRPVHTARNLPALSSPRSVVEQRQTSSSLASQRSTTYSPVPGQQSKALPAVRGKETAGHRPAAQRRVYYPGFQAYQPGSRSLHQSVALHAARQEAAQQHENGEIFPSVTSPSRRLSTVRTSQVLQAQTPYDLASRSSRQLSQQPTNHYQPGRTVDATSAQTGGRRSLPAGGESSARPSTQDTSHRVLDPQTEHFDRRYPQTDSLRQQPSSPQTGQRNPQLEEQRRNPDIMTGSLRNPLVRRAPYMYENDPLRQELAQQLESPPVRRSSRYQTPQYGNTENEM